MTELTAYGKSWAPNPVAPRARDQNHTSAEIRATADGFLTLWATAGTPLSTVMKSEVGYNFTKMVFLSL